VTATSIRWWSVVHTWTSLICTLFLLVLCLSGLPLIFKDEIDGWIYNEAEINTAADGVGAVALDRLVETAQRRFPAEFIQVFFWSPNQANALVFVLGPVSRAVSPAGMHGLTLDTQTGEIIDEPKPRRGLTFYLLKLHTDLFLGLPATLFLGAMGVIFIVSLISGAVLYAPFVRRLAFGEIRRTSSRVKWLDLHNLNGIVTLAWISVVGATGVLNTLAAPLFDLWRSQEMPRLIETYQGKPLPAQLHSVDDVVTLARQASPGMKIVSVVFPHSRFSSPRHYLVWTKGTTPLTEHLFVPVLVDGETGELTGALSLPWYLRSLELSRPLHFGNYGGLPLKVIWALLDSAAIVVLGSGLYLWFRRRRPVAKARTRDRDISTTPHQGDPVRRQSGKRAAWRMPLLLACLTLIGLVSALLEDGVWDWLSWLMLGVVVTVLGLKTLRSRPA
jgi:uncharacterized iron-regulated membrane protein